MRNVDTEWQSFRDATIPKDASEGQVHDQHMAFLAGAKSLQSLLETHSDEDGLKILMHFEGQVKAAITANRIRAIK